MQLVRWGSENTAMPTSGGRPVQGALVYAVDDVRDGKVDSTVGQIFERVRPYLWTLILAGVLATRVLLLQCVQAIQQHPLQPVELGFGQPPALQHRMKLAQFGRDAFFFSVHLLPGRVVHLAKYPEHEAARREHQIVD